MAGLLMVVGASMIKVPRIQTILHTGPVPATIVTITFVATLFAPIQAGGALGEAWIARGNEEAD